MPVSQTQRRVPRSRRTIATGLAAGALLLAVAGCGGGGTKIDHTVVENAIEVGIAQQQHLLAVVTCPVGVKAEKGKKFQCMATLRSGRQLPISVVSKDDKGNVSYSGFRGWRNGHPTGSAKGG